ncbi:MAG: hypothetical protein HQ591_11370 [candidate division Zixibacteria bacterium]|nr:hypothetical protein [Candidatus Tariuqbacter arcticus]
MLSESESKVRFYRVILMDRTTSPKVNRLIRELTGVNIWEASTLMNVVPSVIVEEIPLHEAIEIKSKLGRLGLRAHIESTSVSDSDGDESDLSVDRTITGGKPSTESPVKEPEPSKESIKPSEAPPDISQPSTSPMKPLPPGRLSSRKRHRISFFRTALPFAGALVVVVIIIYVMGECNGRIPFFEGGGITQYQDTGKPSPQQQFVQTEQDIIAKIQRLREEGQDGKSVISEQPVSDVPTGIPKGGEEPLVKPEGVESASDTSVEDAYSNAIIPSAAGERPAPEAVKEEERAGGDTLDSPLKIHSKGNSKGESGLSPGWLGGEHPSRSPREFVGDSLGEGISDEKLDALMDDARRAVSRNDSAIASQDFHRLKLAEDLVSPSQGDILDRFNSPDYKDLVDKLESIRRSYDLRGGADFCPEITGANIRIPTNLPDGTLMGVEIDLPGGDKPLKYILPVNLNMIEVPQESGLPSGVIIVKIYLMPLREQPDEALGIIGKKGESLAGPFYKGKGKVELSAQLNNRIARWRGEISEEEAEEELKLIASGEGLGSFDVSGIADFSKDEKPFITIAASGVEEEDFLIKACRSTGILTQDMDNPPQYLRLLVNGHQYFIPTFICRRALREYGGDDAAGFEYLANNLLSL